MFKKIEIWVLYLTLVFAFCFAVFFGMQVRYELKGTHRKGVLSKGALFLVEIPTNIKKIFTERHGGDLRLEGNFLDFSGFNGDPNSETQYLLLSRFNKEIIESIVELVDLKTFKVVHTWNPNITKHNILIDTKHPHFENHLRDKTDSNSRLRHPLLTEDGSVLYINQVLEKIGKDSSLIWQNQKTAFHHSLEEDADGNYWIPSNSFPYKITQRHIDPAFGSYADNTLTKVSPEGDILFEKSVSQIFIEHGLSRLLRLGGQYNTDPLHLNDIQPVLKTTKFWKKGDLFLSFRNLSMVMLYRPETNKIITMLSGHTSLQHDVDIISDERIAIFNNDSRFSNKKMPFERGLVINEYNKVVIYNFKTQQYESYLEESLKNNKVRTEIEGQSEILSNGDLFIEETRGGRLLYFKSDGELQWQYINKAEDGHVYFLSWSRILHTPKDLESVRNLLSKKELSHE